MSECEYNAFLTPVVGLCQQSGDYMTG